MGREARLRLTGGGSVPLGAVMEESSGGSRPAEFHQAAPVSAEEAAIDVPMVLMEDGTPYTVAANDPKKHYREPIAIGFAHIGMVHTDFSLAMLRMARADANVAAVHRESSCNLVMNRNIILHRFLETLPELGKWLLFLDTDINFPAFTAATLLKVAIETKADIVAAPYQLTNGCSTFGTAAKGGGYNTQGRFVFDRAYLIDAAGTGCMLISRDLLERMKVAYKDDDPVRMRMGAPWEFCAYDPITIGNKRDFESDDYSLCHRAKDIGARIVGYTGIVLQHLKTKPLTFDGLEGMGGQ